VWRITRLAWLSSSSRWAEQSTASGRRARRVCGRPGPLPVRAFGKGTLEVLQPDRCRDDRAGRHRSAPDRLVGTRSPQTAL